jgi:adenylate kinase
MNLIFLGPPGSGKGTQAKKIAEKLELAHLSTGDLLREAVKDNTALGQKARTYMKAGELVPDELIVGLIEEKLESGNLNQGFILDGFPRTVPQAEALKEMMTRHGKLLDRAILFEVSDEEVIRRLSGRFYCPTCNAGYNYPMQMPKQENLCDNDGTKLARRPDDEEAVVINRLEVYKKQTMPVIDWYKREAILSEISGEGGPVAITERLLSAIKKY